MSAVVLTLAIGVMIAAWGILGHEAPREESAEIAGTDPTALCAVTNCGQRWTTDTHGWRLCLDCLTELTA